MHFISLWVFILWMPFDCQKSIFSGEETDLFLAGTHGYHTFRIPSLIVTPKGAVLAFAEGRKQGSSDTGDIDLVMRRSVDGGKSWSDLLVIWDDSSNVCGNPTPIVDHATGKIWLLLTWNRGDDYERDIITHAANDTRRVFVSVSDDDGMSWSDPRDITKTTKDPAWGWYATGPGMGVQIKHGPHRGRLVVPGNHSYSDPSGTQGGGGFEYGAHCIYSDDQGATWHLGGSIMPKMNESQLVELDDNQGTLMINMRSYMGNNLRAQAYSSDGGLTWTRPEGNGDLIEPVCQASLIRHSWQDDELGSLLIFANPASTRRENFQLKVSRDEGKSWWPLVLLHSGPAAYSALAVLPNGEILCAYERGSKSPYETIRLARVSASGLPAK